MLKKAILGFVLVILFSLILEGCMIGHQVKIDILNAEMDSVKTRLDSLENKVKMMDKAFADSLKSKK